MHNTRRNNSLVSIQSCSVVKGQFNDKPVWAEFCKAWVSFTPDRGREVAAAGETIPVVTHFIRGDFLALKGVTEKMRVVYHELMVYAPAPPSNAQVYEVLASIPDIDTSDDWMLKVQLNPQPYGEIT